ncbi:MAG: L,D-transpeptidase family protein [Bacteriovoracaceae bacterium]
MSAIVATMLTVFVGLVHADENFLPSNILMMDETFAHHVFLVEKSTHKLFIYENDKSYPKLIKTFSIATGKFKGDKAMSGDHKTPEGIYTLEEFLSKQELHRRHGDYAKIYGAGAFPMNYPNFIDNREQNGGGGIWLHSTDDDNRISKGLDSKGCVVVQNADLKDVSQYIEIGHTPIIVVQDIFHLNKSSWERNRKDLHETVQKWSKAWQEKDFDNYIAAYDKDRFWDRSKGKYESFKAYKKAVFSNPGKPVINFNFISIMANEKYAVVTLEQDYHSATINDTGKKTLYLMKDLNYDWKIVGELFDKTANTRQMAFTPQNRYFKE